MSTSRLRTLNLRFSGQWLRALLAAVGSLHLAVALIAVYVGVLAWATLIEKWHGAAAAHSAVYGAGWFIAINVVLAINVACAALIRLPWRLRQTGFLITHGGILVLLAGCLLTHLGGVEAQLPIFEGKTAGRAYDESHEFDLGFQLYLHRFERKLDPGSGMASHYSSLVDFLDRSDPPKILAKNVLITLNAPVDFKDPSNGRTYRLFQSGFDPPLLPGDAEFDRVAGNDRSRDHIYCSRLSINYDPGRMLKYGGSLLIVIGITIVYYLRRYFSGKGDDTNRPAIDAQTIVAGDSSRTSPVASTTRSLLGLFVIAAATTCNGQSLSEADWSTLRHMPVFGEGRVVPLDTFANKTVEDICGRRDPTLAAPGTERRKYESVELLLSWLVEPEKWEKTPFLVADDPWLRADVLRLPDTDDRGRRLCYASPAEVENSEGLGRCWADLQERAAADGADFQLTASDKKLKRLVDAYAMFRLLTFNLDAANDTPRRFFARVNTAAAAWRKLAGNLQAAKRISSDEKVRNLMVQSGDALQKLMAELRGSELSLAKLHEPVADFCETSNQLAARLTTSDDMPLTALAADLARQANEMQLALYDNGETLRLVPALNAGALEENRTPDDDASPWLSFQAMIYGNEALMRPYPQRELKAVRAAWADVKAAYKDRSAADRPARFATAMHNFAKAVRTFGEQIEPVRQQLPIQHRDQALIDVTAYPAVGSTDVEVFYNRLNPFFWSWVVSLIATLCLIAAVGRWQRPLFWLGVAVLIAAQAFTFTGMALRGYITGLVPLTGMFETVVFVALYSALLGLWFALRPTQWFVGPLTRTTTGRHGAFHAPYLERRLFVVAGAIVSFVAMLLAYYAPATVMHRNIGSVTPILRDNFWLAVHVVTIMASYASAVIGLILGNIALGYYLFGRYERATSTSGADGTSPNLNCVRRPPEACAVLAGFTYTAIRITVLLLAAGTILGALWADKAWGRFWAWDPKEVWALISLLVYILILHARYLGWTGNFGMIVAAVFGATAVLFTWYGVNFLLGSGMHAYGSGAGGQWQVGSVLLLQWLFLLAAGVRYLVETLAVEG